MPVLPLFDWPTTTAGASHRVRAPGGYEAWRFVAHDPASETWISASFHLGFPSHRYFRRYLRYRRWPTRFAPPLPWEYPAISISIYRRDRLSTSIVRLPPATLPTRGESGFHLGPHGFSRDENGATRLLAPGIDLVFRPHFSRNPVELFLKVKQAMHCWVLTDGLCDVSGTVAVDQTKFELAGIGFHDQQYGNAPMLRDTLSGHLFLKEKVLAFKQDELLHLATLAPDSLAIETDAAVVAPQARTCWGLAYPREIKLTGGALLAHPRVIHSNLFAAQLIYHGTCNGQSGLALCEIGAPRRLGWSILG